MKPIGGYFELELSKGNSKHHSTPYVMKSGRSALQHLLTQLKPHLVYIPFYTCNALIEPFESTGISYEFYEIDINLEPKSLPELKEGEYFLYVNYLDLKRDVVARLSTRYTDKLFVDCTQAFFMEGNGISWFFNSCRKFFGVPDGSYVYTPLNAALPAVNELNEEFLSDHLIRRFNGQPSEGYSTFLQNEVLAGKGIAGMSRLSSYLLSQVDYRQVAAIRIENYNYLHARLKSLNLFDATADVDCVPMSYPLLIDRAIEKTRLFALGIFIPTFWQDVLNRNTSGFETEKMLTTHLLPIPIDHRYTSDDMEFVCSEIVKILNNTK